MLGWPPELWFVSENYAAESERSIITKYVIGSEATFEYIRICSEVTSSLYEDNLQPIDRLFRLWRSTYFLRAWRLSIGNSETNKCVCLYRIKCSKFSFSHQESERISCMPKFKRLFCNNFKFTWVNFFRRSWNRKWKKNCSKILTHGMELIKLGR